MRVHLRTSDHPSNGIYSFKLPQSVQTFKGSTIALEKISLPTSKLVTCDREDYKVRLQTESRKVATWRKWQKMWDALQNEDWEMQILTDPHNRELENWQKHNFREMRDSMKMAPTLSELVTALNEVILKSLTSEQWSALYTTAEIPLFQIRENKQLVFSLQKLRYPPDYHVKWRDVRMKGRTPEEDRKRIFHIDDFWVYYPLANFLHYMGVDMSHYRETLNEPSPHANTPAEVVLFQKAGESKADSIAFYSNFILHVGDLETRPTPDEEASIYRSISVLSCKSQSLTISSLQEALTQLCRDTPVENIKIVKKTNTYDQKQQHFYALSLESHSFASLSFSQILGYLLKMTTLEYVHNTYKVETGLNGRSSITSTTWELPESLIDPINLKVPACFWCHCNLVPSVRIPKYDLPVSLLRNGIVQNQDEYEDGQAIPLISSVFDEITIHFTLPYMNLPHVFNTSVPLMLQLRLDL